MASSWGRPGGHIRTFGAMWRLPLGTYWAAGSSASRHPSPFSCAGLAHRRDSGSGRRTRNSRECRRRDDGSRLALAASLGSAGFGIAAEGQWSFTIPIKKAPFRGPVHLMLGRVLINAQIAAALRLSKSTRHCRRSGVQFKVEATPALDPRPSRRFGRAYTSVG